MKLKQMRRRMASNQGAAPTQTQSVGGGVRTDLGRQPTFLPLRAANVSGPPTFGHLIRPENTSFVF